MAVQWLLDTQFVTSAAFLGRCLHYFILSLGSLRFRLLSQAVGLCPFCFSFLERVLVLQYCKMIQTACLCSAPGLELATLP